jgi:hypothetical protein
VSERKMPKSMYDEEKFAGFNKLLADSKATGVEMVLVAEPWVLGDDYDEIIENLSRIADSGLSLAIAKRATNT